MPASYTVTLTDAEADTIERLALNTGRRPETILLHIMRNNLFRAVVSMASDEWSHYPENHRSEGPRNTKPQLYTF